MKHLLKTSLLLAGTLAVCTAMAAPRRWNGPAGNDDNGVSIAVDGAGNTYTVGTTDTGGGPGKDVVIVARNLAGNVLWQRQYDGGVGADEYGVKIVLDPFGNMFVLATAVNPGSGKDVLVLKYTLAGAPVNRLYFNGAANRDDIGKDIAYDPANFVIVCGTTENAAGDTDALIMRAMDNLVTGTTRTRAGAVGGNDSYNAVVLEPGGNMCVTGKVVNAAGNNDVIFDRVSPAMFLIGTRTFNSAFNLDDEGNDIALDNLGRAVIVGTSAGAGSGNDILAIKFPVAGGAALNFRFNRGAASDDRATSVAFGPKNIIYVAGTSNLANTDYALLQLNTNLNFGWARFYNGPANGTDTALSLLADSFWVYVTGASEGAGTGYDCATVCWDINGVPTWNNRYDFAGGFDSGTQLAGFNGFLFVAGTSQGGATNLDQFSDNLSKTTGVSFW